MEYMKLYLFLFLLLVLDYSLCTKIECRPEDTIYTYTECVNDNGRWSMQVPKNPDLCQITDPKAPVWGETCSFTCEAGHYLDLASQTCKKCPIGTYSLGSGVRFDIWNDLPEGFESHSETITFAQYGYHTKMDNCSQSLWTATGHSVISNVDDCTSTLSYSVNLKQPGTISFSYQYSDSNIIFHFFVQNNQCQTSQSDAKNVFLNTTGTEWKFWKTTLNEGANVLNWQTTGIMLNSQKQLNPVRIREIEITGVSYTTTCHQCEAGLVASNLGSPRCAPCPVNFYSEVGASSCTPCDRSTHYAPIASADCFPRPPCQPKDYFATHSPCDENKLATITYKWIEPKICLETLTGSVTLPPSGEKRLCSPCNPGFYPTKSDCSPCPDNTFSNGTHECLPCPASTSPHYGLYYLWWDDLPHTMKTSCISLTRDGCVNEKGWEPVGDQVQTLGIHSEDAYLILVLRLRGFLSQIDENIFGRITFAFEMVCDGDCQFYFMQDRLDGTSVLEGWTGMQMKQIYTYDININDTHLSFTWAFKKMDASDLVRMYLINVTNTIDSSADSCTPCAADLTSDSKCIPCPAGNYLDLDKRECVPCTGNTILNSAKTACLECGYGTTATPEHDKCSNDCHYTSPVSGLRYDFTNLSAVTSASTTPSFTNTGKQYNHVYNFSLCDNKGRGAAQCIDNLTYAHSGLFSEESLERLTGMVCRSTAFPMFGVGNDQLNVHSQPILIASHLIGVSDSPNSTDPEFPKDDPADPSDVIYHMGSSSSPASEGCPNGRHAFIHLRCSPDVTDQRGVIEMKNGCPDGTCNGCDYHFLWRALAACPMCTEGDYEKVVGACKDAKVTTTFLWKRYPQKCRDGVALPPSSVSPCTDVMIYVELGILCAIVVLIITSLLIYVLYKKNKKLEYKYHRLVVDGYGGKSAQLPAADSCAISDSESDPDDCSDEVLFQKKKSRLFAKKEFNNVSLKSATTGV